jgi:hypothetical protein
LYFVPGGCLWIPTVTREVVEIVFVLRSCAASSIEREMILRLVYLVYDKLHLIAFGQRSSEGFL